MAQMGKRKGCGAVEADADRTSPTEVEGLRTVDSRANEARGVSRPLAEEGNTVVCR